MRFDRPGGHVGPKLKNIPKSMLPVEMPENYTPFPLPKYDDSLGFGPLRLKDVPDIGKSLTSKRSKSISAETLLLQDELEETELALQGDGDVSPIRGQDGKKQFIYASHKSEEPDCDGDIGAGEKQKRFSEEKLQRQSELYTRDVQKGVDVDVNSTDRPLEDLLEQFCRATSDVARAAASADIVSQFYKYDRFQVARTLQIFTSRLDSKRPMQFRRWYLRHVTFGRVSMLPNNPMINAYTNLFDVLQERFCEEEPQLMSPDIIQHGLTLLANAKIFDQNAWFHHTEMHQSSTATSFHSHNPFKFVRGREHGFAFVDRSIELLALTEYVEAASTEDLLGILSAFSLLMKDGAIPGGVSKRIIDTLISRNDLTDEECCRLLFICAVSNLNDERVVVKANATKFPSPDYFSCVPRFRPWNEDFAMKKLMSSLEYERSRKVDPDSAFPGLLHQELRGFVDAGRETIMAIGDRGKADEFIGSVNFDDALFSCMPYFCSLTEEKRKSLSVFKEAGKIGTLDEALVLHSSGILSSKDAIVRCVRRLVNGRTGLIVTTTTLMELTHALSDPGKRRVARRALEVLCGLGASQRYNLFVMPFSEELGARNPAGEYFDEDLGVWNVVNYLQRKLPMVRPCLVADRNQRVARPDIFLKRKLALNDFGATPMSAQGKNSSGSELIASNNAVYTCSVWTPQRLVKDRKSTLHEYKPTIHRLMYRKNRPMYEKYTVESKHLAPGRSAGSLMNDTRGLGIYTPDHPQRVTDRLTRGHEAP